MVISPDCDFIQLRRERMNAGNGRIYTITLAVQDASGNITYADYQASVPRWPWGWYSIAVEGPGPGYSVDCGAGGGTAVIASPTDGVGNTITMSGAGFEVSKPRLSVYPNPFHSETNLTIYVSEAGFATVEIFNIQGQLVRNLYAGQMETGEHQLQWNGATRDGQAASVGLYLVRMKIGEEVLVKKIALQRL
jgi:hypothetical protein